MNVWRAGWKPSITLEELKLPYKVHQISLSKNEQKQVDYAFPVTYSQTLAFDEIEVNNSQLTMQSRRKRP
jgi:hypothetical protein